MKWPQLSKLSRAEIREMQNHKLKNMIRHQIPYSPYYHELFAKNKLEYEDIQTTDDLKRIPFTRKEDVAPTADNQGRPKQFILQPDEKLIKKYASKEKLLKIAVEKIAGMDVKRKLEWEYKPIHLHFTTGRTALPTPFAYSAYDLEHLKEAGARMLDVVGASRDLVAINGFPYAPHLAFWQAYHALTYVGMTSFQTGGGKITGTKKIIDAIERMKAGLIIFIPGYAYHLLRLAAEEKRDFSSVKFLLTGGERLSDGFRQKIKEFLVQMGAKDPTVLATYALTEGKAAWIQCHDKSGYHTYPDLEFFEVIDKNGNRVEEGQPGELVYTALDWHGSVVIRYRTGDMIQGIEYNGCPFCGRTVPIIKSDIQRSSEIKEFHLTKVKGELINLNNFYTAIGSEKEVKEWQVEIRKKHNDPFEIDEIVVYVALIPDTDFDRFRIKMEKKIREEIFVQPIIMQADLDTLLERLGMETELKEKRIVDTRPKMK